MRGEAGEVAGLTHPECSWSNQGACPPEAEGEEVGEIGVDILGHQLASPVPYSLMDFAGLSVVPALDLGWVVRGQASCSSRESPALP